VKPAGKFQWKWRVKEQQRTGGTKDKRRVLLKEKASGKKEGILFVEGTNFRKGWNGAGKNGTNFKYDRRRKGFAGSQWYRRKEGKCQSWSHDRKKGNQSKSK